MTVAFPNEIRAEAEQELSAETVTAAVKAVARHTGTLDEARDVLRMLGILPAPASPEPSAPQRKPMPAVLTRNPGRCRGCGCPTYSRKGDEKLSKGARIYGARGKCGACYRKELRDESESGPLRTDTAEVLEHLQRLRSAGMGTKKIGRAAGVAASTVHRILKARQVLVRASVARRLLAVELPNEVRAAS